MRYFQKGEAASKMSNVEYAFCIIFCLKKNKRSNFTNKLGLECDIAEFIETLQEPPVHNAYSLSLAYWIAWEHLLGINSPLAQIRSWNHCEVEKWIILCLKQLSKKGREKKWYILVKIESSSNNISDLVTGVYEHLNIVCSLIHFASLQNKTLLCFRKQ